MRAKKVKKERRPKDPEGRMSLGEHLLELRNRLVISAIAVLLMAIVGWIVYPWVFIVLQEPFVEAGRAGLKASINFQGIGTGLNTRLQMAAYLGIIFASPVVLYEIWAYITPGLHKHERRYALGFFFSAVPLFFLGCAAGYFMLNKAVPLLLEFAPQVKGVTQIINYADYLNLLVKTVLAFGIAFDLPVVLVALNFLGILSGRSMLKAWRWVTLLCFAFTAVMVPTPDPFTMIFMALPMVALYFIAVGISIRRDRKREKAAEADLDDDRASVIDAPSSIDEVDER